MHLYSRKNRTRRGQTLIIAIMVMFILAVVATVFIALVARNLSRSARSYSTDAVASIAEAGIRYADEMLTTSDEGADWRPIPDDVPPALSADDPDFQWVRPYSIAEAANGSSGPSGGFTRFNSGQGRFLLRVSYNPDRNVTMSKYIKIETVGRWGTIDPADPTTLRDAAHFRLRREITAFKPIGITDYCRFITNKDNRSTDIPLGVPGYRTNFGRSTGTGGISKYGERGGPIRVNGNLLWYGMWDAAPSVNVFLRGVVANDLTQAPNARLPIDGIEVAGDIKTDADPANSNNRVIVRLHQLIDGVDTAINVLPSDDAGFITADGFYRDGSNSGDASVDSSGNPSPRPRGVKRIEPPLVDQTDPTNTTTRYKVLTLNSGERKQVGTRWVNVGALGWGKGVYINNTNDKQDNSDTLGGSFSLRADWTQPNNMMSSSWKGPYYVPPGVMINLSPDDKETINGKTQYYFTMTRTDTINSGQKAIWSDAGGFGRQDWGQTVRMPYPDSVNGRTIQWYDGTGNLQSQHIDGNGVIFAEGNIRIRGMLPPGMKLTIVSNQNIYIEGNVLKYREPGVPITDTDNYRHADPTCGLALLARLNVVVNTTQFLSPLSNIGPDDQGADSLLGGNSYHLIVKNSPESQFRCRFDFGPYESETGTAPDKWRLFLRHSGEAGAAYINAWLNPTDTKANWGIMNLNSPLFAGMPTHVWGVGDPRFTVAGVTPGPGVGSSFIYNVFELGLPITENANDLIPGPGVPNVLQIALDQAVYARSNYWLGGCAVLPMDVRIEAILYAQEGSFFVIPGNWINPDSSDTDMANRPPGVDKRFPLYGQSMDIRIIIDGAVSENMPAVIGDVEEWMAKWSRIPDEYGSSGIATAHRGEGITFLYDDHIGWPLDDAGVPIRVDAYNRTLPLTPKLPVSASLIYFGDVM